MGRMPCCEKVGLRKGSWTLEEDHKLVSYIEKHGPGGWRTLPSKAGLQRCGKSCRLRWTNYLRPDIKRGKFNVEEEQTIIRLHALLGNRWSMIANHLPKRTDNEIKNYWNTHLMKRLIRMGIDPISHKRRITSFGVDPKNVTNLSHMAQWENARLEAEGRFMREANKHVFIANKLAQKEYSAQLVEKPTLSRLMQPQPVCFDVLTAWKGIILESSTSTFKFSNNTPAVPNIGLIDNDQFMSLVNDINVMGMCGEGEMMKINTHNDSKIVESNSIPQRIKEMENSIKLHENFTEFLNANNTYNSIANDGGLEVNWNNILNNFANSSPLGSVCFPN